MTHSTHRPACLCGAGCYQAHCVSCGAEAIPVQYRLRWWVIAPLVVVFGLLGWWVAGKVL